MTEDDDDGRRQRLKCEININPSSSAIWHHINRWRRWNGIKKRKNGEPSKYYLFYFFFYYYKRCSMNSRMKWAYTIAKLFNRRNIYVQDTIVRFFWGRILFIKRIRNQSKSFFSLFLLFIVDQSVVKTSLRIRIIFSPFKRLIFSHGHS